MDTEELGYFYGLVGHCVHPRRQVPAARAGPGALGAQARYPTFPRWRRPTYGLRSRSGTGSGRRAPLQPESFRRTPRTCARSVDPGVRASLAKHDGEPMSMTQPDFTRFVLRESESATRIIGAAGSNRSSSPPHA